MSGSERQGKERNEGRLQNVLHDGVASAEKQGKRPQQIQPETNSFREKLEGLGKEGDLTQIVVKTVNEPENVEQ